MANNHIKSDIPAYLNDQVSEPRRRDIDAHIAACDECRNALNKAKGKQARLKRQALKSAMPDKVPNLLLTRLGRDTRFDEKPSRRGWLWFGAFFLLLGISYSIARHGGRGRGSVGEPVPGLPTSTTTAKTQEAFQVQVSTTTPVAVTPAAPQTEVAAAPETPQRWSEPDSQIKERREVVIRGRSSWLELWTAMGHEGQAPRVNFNELIVVGIFAGEKVSGGYQVTLEAPKDLGDHVEIAYHVAPPAQALPGITHPYTLMTLPRVPKRVRFQEQ